MDLHFSPEDEAFRDEVRTWLEENLSGPFAHLRSQGNPNEDLGLIEALRAWERRLGEGRWLGLGYPKAVGGRDLPLFQQVIFNEEYVRAKGPWRLGHIGETLLGPTVVHFGTEAQKGEFLPPILAGDVLWCQGYSEPEAGSDLANVKTKATLEGDHYVLQGQKIWTSHAAWSDWCFVVARTDPDSHRHKGLSYVLVPMKQAGIDIRPIEQMTGTSEFSEVFFDGAKASKDHVIGGVGNGWRVALGTLAFERGASTLGQQLGFEEELRQLIAIAKENGAAKDPILRDRLAQAHIEVKIMRLSALRTLSNSEQLSRAGMTSKLYWASWHRRMGELAMEVLGHSAEYVEESPYHLSEWQHLFLFSRSSTIYAGSNQIQRNIIAQRALGLPRGDR